MTKQECVKIIKNRDDKSYTLRHGEYARPLSKVRKYPGCDKYGISTQYSYCGAWYSIS